MDRVVLAKGCPYGAAGWQDVFVMGQRTPMVPYMERLRHINHSVLHKYLRTGRWIAEGFAFDLMQRAFSTAMVRAPSIAMVIFRSNISCAAAARGAPHGVNAPECVQLKR